MKKSLSLIATITLVLAPVTAFAQNAQVSIQESSNSAAAVGTNNLIMQNNSQTSVQNGLGIGNYNSPSTQQSIQQSHNKAAAIGNNNVIGQNNQQHSVQNQAGINTYFNPYLGK